VRFTRFGIWLGILWTATLLSSLGWNHHQEREAITDLATATARAAFEKDLSYRRWNAMQGGVYVFASEFTPPNPNLSHLPDRDLITADGRTLTRVNPAYMTRQVHELAGESSGVRGHITSLKPIRLENGPDVWEREALERFESGTEEVAEVVGEGGVARLRLMGRLLTEESCLTCHASQGYKLGEVRGGISVSIPMASYFAVLHRRVTTLAAWHGFFWLVGLAAIGLSVTRMNHRAEERERAGAALRESLARQAELNEQLQQSRRLEAIGRLAGGVAHDFNNLLVPILGNVALAMEDAPADAAELRESLQEIKFAGERARELTQRLLALGRRQPQQRRPVDLGELIDVLRPLLQRLLGENIEVQASLVPGLPPALADRGQLEMALVNLAANARDAMPYGGKLVLRTSLAQLSGTEARANDLEPGRYLSLEVEDDGQGMDEATLAHLFEPFFTTKPQGRGTGLGLATVHSVVRQHGGAVTAHSQPGRGTTFRILLPAADGAPVAEQAASAPIDGRGVERVLVAEDDAGCRKLIKTALEARGYQVLLAEDGEAALRLASGQAGGIDLLISDVIMPRMGGAELRHRLSALRPELRVLFISGHTGDAFGTEGAPPSGSPLLNKPFSPDELAAAVRAALDAAALPRQPRA
jgi:signal transduction histidine kinase/ActR/RegA family two-component response regulator